MHNNTSSTLKKKFRESGRTHPPPGFRESIACAHLKKKIPSDNLLPKAVGGGGQSVRYFYYKNLIKLEIFRGVRTNPNPQSDPSRSDYVETIWLINYKTCSLIYHQIVKWNVVGLYSIHYRKWVLGITCIINSFRSWAF